MILILSTDPHSFLQEAFAGGLTDSSPYFVTRRWAGQWKEINSGREGLVWAIHFSLNKKKSLFLSKFSDRVDRMT